MVLVQFCSVPWVAQSHPPTRTKCTRSGRELFRNLRRQDVARGHAARGGDGRTQSTLLSNEVLLAAKHRPPRPLLFAQLAPLVISRKQMPFPSCKPAVPSSPIVEVRAGPRVVTGHPILVWQRDDGSRATHAGGLLHLLHQREPPGLR